jgi:hypothetical protein
LSPLGISNQALTLDSTRAQGAVGSRGEQGGSV